MACGLPPMPAELREKVQEVAAKERGRAPWYQPTGGVDLGLRVNNTLVGGKAGLVPFVPADGRTVKWYTCGPTVYDSCHMGHARAYLTFDILRRIMEDYFGYDVEYHINITDVDDKIIKRARRNKLIADFLDMHKDGELNPVITAVDDAVSARVTKLTKKQSKLNTTELPADAPSKLREEHETELKETGLKLVQAQLTAARVAAVKRAIESGVASVLSEYEVKATEMGIEGAADGGDSVPLLSARLQTRAAIVACSDAEDSSATLAAINQLQELALAVERVSVGGKLGSAIALVEAARDEIGEKLDAELGSTVRDHSIFNAHSRHFEKEYMEDMEALGVRPPDILTRVTEHIATIIAFVEKIIANGLAYTSNGSVYLSIDDFKKDGHHYRKLKPGEDTTEKEMAEGEGDLAGDGMEKRHKNDFALWKASKPGEPEWDSPWGKGRPGWHIECSAIASDLLGPYMDIHAGGIDLAFPHHDNELAQSEACFGHHQWVSYFFHAGHLHIEGLKMSKSLKNFITIRQALAKHTLPDGTVTQTTARHLRIMFLLQAWDKPMDYSDQKVADAKAREQRFRNFFNTVKTYLKEDWLSALPQIGQTSADRELQSQLRTTKQQVHDALCSNFGTSGALKALETLISAVNKAFAGGSPSHFLINKCGVYVTKILRIFGVVDGSDAIGFPAVDGGSGESKEATVSPYVDALVNFRDTVRGAARAKADPKTLLEACDQIRDDTLIDLGIRLEDSTQEGSASKWHMDDPGVLRRELEEKRAKQREQARQKVANKIAKKEKELAKARTSAVPPSELFKGTEDQYSAYDPETGVPTKLANGDDLPKKASKALQKKYTTQVKDHDKLKAAAPAGNIPAYIQAIEEEIIALQEQLAA